MSLSIVGSDATLIFILLIALNVFFCFKVKPIINFAISGISILFLIFFDIDFNGLNILLTLILLVFIFADFIEGFKSYTNK
jgi:hypothetical protein